MDFKIKFNKLTCYGDFDCRDLYCDKFCRFAGISLQCCKRNNLKMSN